MDLTAARKLTDAEHMAAKEHQAFYRDIDTSTNNDNTVVAWISLDDERSEPNRHIHFSGFPLDQPDEQVESHDISVDQDGLFPTSPRVQNTHW